MRVLSVTSSQEIPTKPMDGLPTLVYWNTLGLAQSIRLSLVVAGVEFCDVRIEAGNPQDDAQYKSNWYAVKSSMPLTFPNLPYFLDPQKKTKKKNEETDDDGGTNNEFVALSHTNTILRYIDRKWNRLGTVASTNRQEKPSPPPSCRRQPEYVSDLILDEVADLEWMIIDHAYYKGPDSLLEWFQRCVPTILARFQTLAAPTTTKNIKNKSSSSPSTPQTETDTVGYYLTGSSSVENPFVADIKFYVLLYKLHVIQTQLDISNTILDQEWIQSYMQQMESVPSIAVYMASPHYMKSPMNYPAAKWIG